MQDANLNYQIKIILNMKNLFIAFIALFLVVGTAQAQDGKKMLKNAKKAIGKYNSDPIKNAEMLSEGLELLEQAFGDAKVSGEAKNYITKGKIFQELLDNEVKMNLLNPEAKIGNPMAGINAYEAFAKALEIAEKGGDKKAALKGISAVEGNLNNVGIAMYNDKDYETGFKNFVAGIDAFKLLKANEKESRLDEESVYKDHIFFTGVNAYLTEDKTRSIPYFEELYDQGAQEALVYEALYKMTAETDKEKAVVYLNKGRELFPDDTGMLFTEINHYLAEGKMDILLEKLDAAAEKEPDNMSVLVTRGKVYDELHATAMTEGDEAKSVEYFNKALADYNGVLEKDAENFDATYSIGALYYNKAAGMAEEINKLANDYSKEGTAKYNKAKKDMDAIFGEALPFFEKADKIKGDDMNTLIALKEIYARQSNFEKSNEYKEKIESASN